MFGEAEDPASSKSARCGFARITLNSRDGRGRGRSAAELAVRRLAGLKKDLYLYGILVAGLQDQISRKTDKIQNSTWRLNFVLLLVAVGGTHFAVIQWNYVPGKTRLKKQILPSRPILPTERA